MAKFIFSMGNENYRKLQLEAKTRDVTIQALIRTVMIGGRNRRLEANRSSIARNDHHEGAALANQPF